MKGDKKEPVTKSARVKFKFKAWDEKEIARNIKADLDKIKSDRVLSVIAELKEEIVKKALYSIFWLGVVLCFICMNLIGKEIWIRGLGLIGIFSSLSMLAYTSSEIWLCVVGIKSAKGEL